MRQKKHIDIKKVVGVLLVKVVSIKKKHIMAKDEVGLLLGEVVSRKKKILRRKGCGWLTSRR